MFCSCASDQYHQLRAVVRAVSGGRVDRASAVAYRGEGERGAGGRGPRVGGVGAAAPLVHAMGADGSATTRGGCS